MIFNDNGYSKDIIKKILEDNLKKDMTYDSGRIISSMCTPSHPFAKRVYSRYLEKNLGDVNLFPGTVKIEKEAIRMIGSLLANPEASGHIVSGGTEANLMAMWVARNLTKKKRPELIVPTSAHFSFDKAADLLGLKLIKVGLNENFQVKIEAVKNAITSNTIAIVGMAGSTELGIIDSISDLSDIAVNNNIFLHVDASFGGFVLPFLKDIGYYSPDFDFKLKGVSSITIDPHKMGLAPIPAGGILFRKEDLLNVIGFNAPYLSLGGSTQYTLIGTRSGASAIAIWALLKYLGKEGYRKIIKKCMDLTYLVAKKIKESNRLRLTVNPVVNIVGIASHSHEPKRLALKLQQKGWAISSTSNCIRLVLMPHVKRKKIMNFLLDLEEVAKDE